MRSKRTTSRAFETPFSRVAIVEAAWESGARTEFNGAQVLEKSRSSLCRAGVSEPFPLEALRIGDWRRGSAAVPLVRPLLSLAVGGPAMESSHLLSQAVHAVLCLGGVALVVCFLTLAFFSFALVRRPGRIRGSVEAGRFKIALDIGDSSCPPELLRTTLSILDGPDDPNSSPSLAPSQGPNRRRAEP